MVDEICKFMLDSGRGQVHQMAELRTKMDLPGGRTSTAWLCASENNVWIVAFQDGIGKAIEAPVERLSLTKNFWGSALRVGEQPYALPIAGSTPVREVIAAARLYHPNQHERTEHFITGPYIEELNFQEQRWLLSNLNKTEVIIAILETNTSAEVNQLIKSAGTTYYRFVLTDIRCGLLAVTDLGDQIFKPLKREPMIVEKGFTRANLQCGDTHWKATLTNGSTYENLTDLIPMNRSDRLRVAGMKIRLLEHAGARDCSNRLFVSLGSESSPFDKFISAWMCEGVDVSPSLIELMKEKKYGIKLGIWCAEAELSNRELDKLLHICSQRTLTPEQSAWSLPLHDLKRNRLTQEDLSDLQRFQKELEYIEHILFAGQAKNAIRQLDLLLEQVPNEYLQEALPLDSVDLFKGEGSPFLERRAILLRAHAMDSTKQLTQSHIYTLAKCQPLLNLRAKELSNTSDEQHRLIGSEIINVLQGTGLSKSKTSTIKHFQPLNQIDLEELIHPVARSNGSLAAIQDWVQSLDCPNRGMIRDHCEPLRNGENQSIHKALSDACRLFGLSEIPIYLSRGRRGIGIRSHEEPESFILIGAEHLSKSSPAHMSEDELRALIGAEVFRLYLGHSRLTSEEDWTLAIDNAGVVHDPDSIERLIGIPSAWMQEEAPLSGNIYVPHVWLSSVYELDSEKALVEMIQPKAPKRKTTDLSEANEIDSSLWSRAVDWFNSAETTVNATIKPVMAIAAHRVMQLTADRAGLLVSANISASIRTLFLSESKHYEWLHTAQNYGLNKALNSPDATFRQRDLSIRIANLISFYMSDTYKTIQNNATDHE